MDDVFIEIQQLCQLVHTRGLRELSLSRPGFSVSLSAAQPGTIVLAAPAHLPVAAAVIAEEPSGCPVPSPLVGIFYRASSPTASAFVEIGDTVEAGQVIGVVEAMKVFNEIVTDHAGTVTAIPAENGKLVQAGQPLVVLELTD
jgi:acetyl-CoA carboxylase biotin carboxyl carrier protein